MAEMTSSKSATADSAAHVHHDPLALKLDSLHQTLSKIDQAISRGNVEVPLLHELVTLADDLATFVDKVGPDVRVRFDEMLTFLRALPSDIEAQLAKVGPSEEIESKPLFGVLPLARAVPQDVHSVIDYVGAGGALMTSIFADGLSAKIAGAALGASSATVSALTDYRLGAVKVIPIEAHEAIDHAWGLAAIASPFVLGYYKKSPGVAAAHVFLGASMILVSLFTDYRAAVGVGRHAGKR